MAVLSMAACSPVPQPPCGRRAGAEDVLLEHLHEAQLPAALELEALELRERAVGVEDGVALLEELALLGRRGRTVERA